MDKTPPFVVKQLSPLLLQLNEKCSLMFNHALTDVVDQQELHRSMKYFLNAHPTSRATTTLLDCLSNHHRQWSSKCDLLDMQKMNVICLSSHGKLMYDPVAAAVPDLAPSFKGDAFATVLHVLNNQQLYNDSETVKQTEKLKHVYLNRFLVLAERALNCLNAARIQLDAYEVPVFCDVHRLHGVLDMLARNEKNELCVVEIKTTNNSTKPALATLLQGCLYAMMLKSMLQLSYWPTVYFLIANFQLNSVSVWACNPITTVRQIQPLLPASCQVENMFTQPPSVLLPSMTVSSTPVDNSDAKSDASVAMAQEMSEMADTIAKLSSRLSNMMKTFSSVPSTPQPAKPTAVTPVACKEHLAPPLSTVVSNTAPIVQSLRPASSPRSDALMAALMKVMVDDLPGFTMDQVSTLMSSLEMFQTIPTVQVMLDRRQGKLIYTELSMNRARLRLMCLLCALHVGGVRYMPFAGEPVNILADVSLQHLKLCLPDGAPTFDYSFGLNQPWTPAVRELAWDTLRRAEEPNFRLDVLSIK